MTGYRVGLAAIVMVFIGIGSLVATRAYHRSNQNEQKATRQHITHYEGGAGAPETLAALWQMSDVVVEAVVVGVRPDDRVVPVPNAAPMTIVKSIYQFQVKSVLKSDDRSGQLPTIDVERMGGTRDRGDYIDEYIDESFPAFRMDERYILFLKPTRHETVYQLATDTADSAVLFDNSHVVPRGKSTLARSFEGFSPDQLVARLKELKRGR